MTQPASNPQAVEHPPAWGAAPALPDYGVTRDNVSRLVDAGAHVLAGTDVPNLGTVHGGSLHRELELLVQAGQTPEQALRAATSLPAASYGLIDRGVIAPAKRADLVLVDGLPTREITATRAIRTVWRGGVRHDRTRFAGSDAENELIEARRTQLNRVLEAVKEFMPGEPIPGAE